MTLTPQGIGKVVLIAACLMSCLVVNPYVRGDGNGYYAWLASAVIDHDVDFRNQYRHADPLFAAAYFDENGDVRPEKTTATGHVSNQWSVGPAVLWAPWFLVAHVVVTVVGVDPADGFASWYRQCCAVGSLFYAVMALAIGVRLARSYGAMARASQVAAVAVMLGTSLFVYAYMLPFHVHAMAAFTVACFLWYWHATPAFVTYRQWAIWGALGGLMTMTYHVNALFGFVVLSAALERWRAGERGRIAVCGLIFAVAAIVVCLPQLIGKTIVYGHPLVTGYQDEFFWWSPRLLATAFSTEHGLLLWTPLIVVALAGCVIAAQKARTMQWMLAAASLFYVVIASYQNWHGLSSFGNRFFVSLTVPFVIGIAVVAERAYHLGRRRSAAFNALLMLLVCWNLGLAFQWGTKMIPSRGPVSPSRMAMQQLDVPSRIITTMRHYLGSRDAFVADIERKDIGESREFRNRR